ncbi:hypothetical protein FB45DRAFT_924730 [Roridomyces roridus]|uniref:Uncharacterized protein n=1 Tax=Roridomyces roridus TaxID=1738132 RepID=A0AAD7BJG9_9AGAR|nr:hypothetical protein FB45DRAFT_924730 [Roridomyces roridus]
MSEDKPVSKAPRKAKEPPASPGKVPKKVEVHLPGPAPRTNASPSSKKPKSTHNRSVSSISSMQRITDDATNSPSPNKPLSAIKRKRLVSPETVDDNASVAESSVMGTGTIRRTEAERIEYFKNQPDCAPDIEPHGVMCTRCNKLVNLGRKQTYAVRPWENHRKRCDQKMAAASGLDDAASIRSDARSEVSRSEKGGAVVRMSVDERKAMLDGDPRAEKVEPDQVLCRKCQKWIRLSTKTSYALSNWNTHQMSCADAVMSSRVAMAQRKIKLVNDPQAKTFSARNVECRNCGESIALTGDYDYTLTDWDAHKETCTSAGEKPTKASRAPRSSVSTEATVVVEAEASTSRGTKRPLEDPELPVDDPDAPRAPVRARTETYEPVQKEPPSLLGWFLLPFKGFLQGLREGMSEAPPP